ncbi:hypothetical protein F4803DRAFT_540685 [Xylaria telfairii]|nr:hypothetical protein F4803DRAFT_540685 [Xylaria telfairii]
MHPVPEAVPEGEREPKQQFDGEGRRVRAWGALIQVASLCIHNWDDGELKISGFGEKDCDEFHDQIDELMRVICEAQKESGNVSWLRNGRMEEIQSLQQKAADTSCDRPYTYRYKSTLLFLGRL